jgi:hypothetical protein
MNIIQSNDKFIATGDSTFSLSPKRVLHIQKLLTLPLSDDVEHIAKS